MPESGNPQEAPLKGRVKTLYELNPKSEARNQKQISNDLNDQNVYTGMSIRLDITIPAEKQTEFDERLSVSGCLSEADFRIVFFKPFTVALFPGIVNLKKI